MKVFFEDISVSTKNRTELVDITRNVEEIVRKSGIRNGLCLVHAVHSTVAVIVNENESGLTKDIVKKAQQDFPKRAGWLHNMVDDNADAHCASSFISPSRIFQYEMADLFAELGKTCSFSNSTDHAPEGSLLKQWVNNKQQYARSLPNRNSSEITSH
jgi:secondary thiamine-phosphate synthase enzyme